MIIYYRLIFHLTATIVNLYYDLTFPSSYFLLQNCSYLSILALLMNYSIFAGSKKNAKNCQFSLMDFNLFFIQIKMMIVGLFIQEVII